MYTITDADWAAADAADKRAFEDWRDVQIADGAAFTVMDAEEAYADWLESLAETD